MRLIKVENFDHEVCTCVQKILCLERCVVISARQLPGDGGDVESSTLGQPS